LQSGIGFAASDPIGSRFYAGGIGGVSTSSGCCAGMVCGYGIETLTGEIITSE